MKRLYLLSLGVLLSWVWSGTGAALPTPDADDGGLILEPGFRALVAADKLGHIRFITVAPNGDIYTKLNQPGLLALHDSTGTGRFDEVKTFGMNYASGTGVAVHNGWLYFSTDDAVYRYRLNRGELAPSGEAEPIVTGLPPNDHQHESKVFAFDDKGDLFVEVGCPSNASGRPDRAPGAVGIHPSAMLAGHGGFWRFDANKQNQDLIRDGYHYSTGMRHALAVAWQPVSRSFFVTMMGRDQLNTVDSRDYTAEDNAENPAEEFHILKEHSNFGWPYTYWDPRKQARMVGPEYGGDNVKRDDTRKYPDPLVAFPAHWAMMQMAFYSGTQFPARFRNGTFIASHGSWNRGPLPQAGYKLAFIPFNREGMPAAGYEIFADNFAGVPVIRSPGDARYRPCGVAVGPDGSLYVGDSEKGRIWRIIYTGETNAAALIAKAAAATSKFALATSLPPGMEDTPSARLYLQSCGVCHMGDGNGVANMQPALNGSAVVAGDVNRLLHVVLEGPAKVLPASRTHYSNVMPPMNILTDAQISTVLTFVRTQFGHGASAVSVDQVAKVRGEIENPVK